MQTGISAVKVARASSTQGSVLAVSSEKNRQLLGRLLLAAAFVCLVGAGISATIANVHSQIDNLGDEYTSFCNVNESINCDVVLSSPYAKLAGIPVAHFALLAYLALTLLFGAAARTTNETRRRTFVGLGAFAVLGSLVFSAYMAVVSFLVLKTACLLCMGLYAVALASTGLVGGALAIMARSGHPVLSMSAGLLALAGSTVVVALLAFVTWPSPPAGLSVDITNLEDVRQADPEFFAWYTGLPRIDVAALVREDQRGGIAAGKVTIVDFFDLDCGHCRRNHFLLKDLAARRPDAVALVHRHFPLDAACNDVVTASVHPNACRAAEAVECASVEGKQEEMLDVLFENQGQLFMENLLRLGARIGLDRDKLQRCLDERTMLPRVLEDSRAGARLEITSTPTVFVGGRRIRGTLDSVAKYEMAVVIEGQQSARP